MSKSAEGRSHPDHLIKRMKLWPLIVMALFSCGDAPDIVFPEAGNEADIFGRVYPALGSTAIYLLGAGSTDSTTPDSISGLFKFAKVSYGIYYLQVKTPEYGTTEIQVQATRPVINLEDIKLSRMPLQVAAVWPAGGTVFNRDFQTRFGSLVTDSSYIVRIIFRNDMDTVSVANALRVVPPQTASAHTWEDGGYRECSIHLLRRELAGSTRIMLTVDTLASDIYGTRLEMPLSLEYTVDSASSLVVPPAALIRAQSPRPDERNYGTETPLTFWFDSLMLETSVEKAFHISPPTTPHFTWDFSSPTNHRLNVTFANGLSFGTWYTVTFDAGWMTVDSMRAGSSYRFRFETERPTIRTFSPINGETGVPLTAPITFATNFDVDYGNAVRSFSIVPPPDSLRFSLEARTHTVTVDHVPFDAATAYTVTIDSLLCARDLSTIGRAVSFSFRTRSPDETWGDLDTVYWNSNPASGAREWPIGSGVSISFDAGMDFAAVESALTVTPSISWYPAWTPGSRSCRLDIKPMHILRSNTTYTVRIDSGHLSIDGVKNNPVAVSFTTKPLRLIGHSPSDGQRNTGTSARFALSFSVPVDTATLAAALRLSPAVGGLIVDSIAEDRESDRWMYLLSHDPFTADTTYTVTVDTLVTDLFGVFSTRGTTFEFSTGK